MFEDRRSRSFHDKFSPTAPSAAPANHHSGGLTVSTALRVLEPKTTWLLSGRTILLGDGFDVYFLSVCKEFKDI